MMPVVSKCEWCGKPKEYEKIYLVKRFCSYRCSGYYRWTKREKPKTITIKCKACKENFTLLDSKYRARKNGGQAVEYCSRKCAGEGQKKDGSRTKIICAHCGKEKIKRTDHLYERNYCSKKCAGEGRKKAGPWSETEVDHDARRKYFRTYYMENAEKIKDLSRRWAMTNKPKRQHNNSQRRIAGGVNRKTKDELLRRANFKCQFCGAENDLQIDHIVATTRGGKTTMDNMQILCGFCNRSKGNGLKPKSLRSAS